MNNLARGYIASGEFNGYRTPQHIQNQIIKNYCDANSLNFVLSRAEYWINGSTQCQLWACLQEGFKHIVFFSLWQLPNEKGIRSKIFEYCAKASINIHFATERMSTGTAKDCFLDIEILIQCNSIISKEKDSKYLDLLRMLV